MLPSPGSPSATAVDGARPPLRRPGTALLTAGGLLAALNGAIHFVLPVIYPWAEHAEGLYEPVRWALYATTLFFGVLLVIGGTLTVVIARATAAATQALVWVVTGMAGFWLLAAAYEVIVPFPDPAAAWALPIFSIIVALLHLVGLWLRLRSGGPRPRPER